MARKTRQKKPKANKPNKAILAGSSNNLQTDQLAKFPIKNIVNKARRGGNAIVGWPNNYCLQLLPLKPRTVYIILLSFNHIFQKEGQIKQLSKFTLRVRQCLNILRTHGLDLQNNLIIGLPPLRLHPETWDHQRAEIEKLKTILDTKGIFNFNPMNGIPAEVLQNNYFGSEDQVHLTPEVDRLIAVQTADALKTFYTSRW